MSDAAVHPVPPPPNEAARLLASGRFMALMATAFIAYANVAVFFGFVDHLRDLAVSPHDYGILVAAMAAAALIVRPLISPFFHAANARPLLLLGTILAAGTLAAYSLATDFWSMLLVRASHGLAFAVLGTALMAAIIEVIPKARSAQFFGYLAVVTLLPNTLVPPLLPFLDALLGGFNRILLLFSLLTLLVLPMALLSGSGQPPAAAGEAPTTALTGREIARNLGNLHVLRILAAMLLLYSGHALVFFFLDGYGRSIGVAYAGVFLTLSTVGEIGIRVTAGSFFDRLDKQRMAAICLTVLALAYVILAYVPGKGIFFALGLIFGLGWGVAMPVFNGLMFEASEPRFRAFNINLGLQMFQAGFFVGPLVGATLLSRWGYGPLYGFCALLSFLGAVLMLQKGTSR